MAQLVTLFVVLCTKLIKYFESKKRSVFEAHVLPKMTEIKFCTCCKNRLGALILKVGIAVNNVGKQIFVLVIHKLA